MMKQVMALILTLCMLLTLMAGCGSQTASSAAAADAS